MKRKKQTLKEVNCENKGIANSTSTEVSRSFYFFLNDFNGTWTGWQYVNT